MEAAPTGENHRLPGQPAMNGDQTDDPGRDDRAEATFDAGALGTWIEAPSFVVTRALIDAYAEAVDAPPTGLAAPLLSVVACYPVMVRAVDAVTPPSLRGAAVHGEHDVAVHRLVRPADVLTARARPVGFAANRAGTAVHVQIVVTDEHAEPVATHRLTAIVRGPAPTPGAAGSVPPSWSPPTRGEYRRAGLAVPVGVDQPARYAEATGDRNAVHIDPAAGRDAGFGGVIAHGLGVLGLTTSALVSAFSLGSPDRLARIRTRFSAPVTPGQALSVSAAEHADGVRFEARTAAGTLVLRDGWAVFRS
jgi:acyl dehydratase